MNMVRLGQWGGRQLRDAAGFTLIELTVVLAVIVTLALVLTPSVTGFINDSRVARTRSDTQTIASAILQFYKDNGFFPQWSAAQNGGPGTGASKVDLLISDGNVPTVSAPNLWTTGTADTLVDQLQTNAPGFTLKGAASTFGWNGPYLSSGIGADAWNYRYSVNIGLMEASQGTQTAAGATKSVVWVLSPGANGQIDTAYTQAITVATLAGDDIAIRVQ